MEYRAAPVALLYTMEPHDKLMVEVIETPMRSVSTVLHIDGIGTQSERQSCQGSERPAPHSSMKPLGKSISLQQQLG